MIQLRTIVKVADNTGVRRAACFHVYGGYQKRYGRIGDIIALSVKDAVPHSMVKKGEVLYAVIVRTRKEFKRKDGTYVRFGDNAVVIIDKKSKEPKGTRIFGPIPREIKSLGFTKIGSLAQEVL